MQEQALRRVYVVLYWTDNTTILRTALLARAQSQGFSVAQVEAVGG